MCQRGNKGGGARRGPPRRCRGPRRSGDLGWGVRSPRRPAGGVAAARSPGDGPVWQGHLLRREDLVPAERRGRRAAFFRPGPVAGESLGRPSGQAAGLGQLGRKRTRRRASQVQSCTGLSPHHHSWWLWCFLPSFQSMCEGLAMTTSYPI